MLLGGDEFLRTQQGNNNAYCQDNDLSYVDWSLTEKNADMLRFVRTLIAAVKKYPALQRRKFFLGRDMDLDGIPDISWYGEKGPVDWNDSGEKLLCYLLDGGEIDPHNKYFIFVILNSDHSLRQVTLPLTSRIKWKRVLDTSLPSPEDIVEIPVYLDEPTTQYLVNPRSVVVLVSE